MDNYIEYEGYNLWPNSKFLWIYVLMRCQKKRRNA